MVLNLFCNHFVRAFDNSCKTFMRHFFSQYDSRFDSFQKNFNFCYEFSRFYGVSNHYGDSSSNKANLNFWPYLAFNVQKSVSHCKVFYLHIRIRNVYVCMGVSIISTLLSAAMFDSAVSFGFGSSFSS